MLFVIGMMAGAFVPQRATAQAATPAAKSSITFGLEQDVLPYILKGYILTGWTGRDRMRIRFSYAKSTLPGLVMADHLEEDRVNAFGISAEYFLKDYFEGLWFGPGIGHWTNKVKAKSGETLTHESMIFSFGGGYNLRLKPWLYCSPWLALHSRVSGTDAVPLGAGEYRPMVFTPEVSFKLGVKLGK